MTFLRWEQFLLRRQLMGRFAVGRVLRNEFRGGAHGVMIAVSPWLGKEMPSPNLPAIREILYLNHHKWSNKPEVFWGHDPMPDSFKIVGQAELSAADRKLSSDTFSSWQSVPLQAVLQWRWDHEREALLREEALQAAELAESRRQIASARAEFMRTLTLDILSNRIWFATWEDVDSTVPLDECRSLIVNLINDLRSAPKLTLGFVKKRLKESVLDFNRLDREQQFITTIEREDICEAYEQIICAARFPQLLDQIERWREW